MFSQLVLLMLFMKNGYSRVPPAACLAKPRWDDCGKAPTPVMYYYKPGSRCEIGFWRGCYPNHNMFKDEYECVSKCIFGSRAESEDYHKPEVYDQSLMDETYENLEASKNLSSMGAGNASGIETKGDNASDIETKGDNATDSGSPQAEENVTNSENETVAQDDKNKKGSSE